MNPRQELEQLRKMKRLKELEAKEAASSPRTPQSEQPVAAATAQPPEEDSVMGRLSNPERWKAIAGIKNEYSPDVVAGVPPMAIPVGSAATQGIGAVDKLAQFFGKSAPARIAGSTGVGAIMDSDNPLQGAAIGLGTGVLGEGAAKLLGGASGAISRPRQVARFAKDPVMAQDVAASAIEGADDALRQSYQSKIDPKLAQMEYKLDPRQYQGSVPEADAAIRRATVNQQYPTIPNEITVPAQEGEAIRRALEAEVKYPRGTSVAIPKEVADKYAANKALADNIRRQRSLGADEELASLYDDWHTRLGQAEDISRKSGRPISALTGGRGDDLALRMKIDQAIGSDLTGLGEKLAAGEQLRGAKGFIDPLSILGKESVKGAWRAGKDASASGLEAFVHGLMGKTRSSQTPSK